MFMVFFKHPDLLNCLLGHCLCMVCHDEQMSNCFQYQQLAFDVDIKEIRSWLVTIKDICGMLSAIGVR
jgi:hypothetical protein